MPRKKPLLTSFLRRLLSVAIPGLMAVACQAATTGYWRMELDSNATAGLTVANEVAGGTALTAANASVTNDATSPPGVPVTVIPLTGAPNAFSLNGNANIDGAIPVYSLLNSGSITIELWARTLESAGTLLARGNGTTAGFVIDNFNALSIAYATDNGAGGVTGNTLAFGLNFDATWRHVAFTYDATLGLGSTYVDGVLKNTLNGADGLNLVWTGTTQISVGGGMDGGTVSAGSASGYVDELRISDTALAPSQFLNAVPEPSTALSVALGLTTLLSLRRRRS